MEAMFWLGLARSAILTIPFRWISRLSALQLVTATTGSDACYPETYGVAKNIGWAVTAAAARSPWKSACLAQALAGTTMLRLRGIPATVALGVAKSTSKEGELEAHAWLSCGELILTGAAGINRFSVVARYHLAPRQSEA